MWPEQGNQQRAIANQTVLKESAGPFTCRPAGHYQGMLDSKYL